PRTLIESVLRIRPVTPTIQTPRLPSQIHEAAVYTKTSKGRDYRTAGDDRRIGLYRAHTGANDHLHGSGALRGRRCRPGSVPVEQPGRSCWESRQFWQWKNSSHDLEPRHLATKTFGCFARRRL